MDSISDRFKSLGVHFGTRTTQPEQIPASWPVEAVVAGSEFPTIYGSVFTTARQFGLDYTHGSIHLHSMPGLQMLAEWGRTPHIPEISHRQIVFLDTETSGLAGGTGTYAFMVGIGYFETDSFKVLQFFMRDPSEEAALLAGLIEYLSQFQAIVSFNGKSFDIPLLKTRFMMNGLTEPFQTMEHLDLLHLARRLWRNRLESRAMGDLEKEILGFFREKEEVPGYLIPQYYFDYLRTQDARPLGGVFYHNAIDIVSLAALFEHMAGILEKPQEMALPSLDIAAIARLYEETGHLEDAAELFESSIDQGLPREVFINTLERFAQLRRKQDRLDLAVKLWCKAAEQNHIPAYIELAKYYEHQAKDLDAAMAWCRLGVSKIPQYPFPRYLAQTWKADLEKRIDRLAKKINRAAIR